MSVPALVVFDMAGTTVEDRGEVPAAFAAALSRHGRAVSPVQINGLRGASKRQAILSLVPAGPNQAAEAAAIYDTFRRDLAARYQAGGVRAIAGAGDLFRELREMAIKVALTTGFDRDITELLLTALQWRDAVDAVVCGDDVANGRPAPDLILRAMGQTGVTDPAAVAVVGDTTLDLEAAARAGVGWNIGVLSGAHRREAMALAPHTHLVESVAALRLSGGSEDPPLRSAARRV